MTPEGMHLVGLVAVLLIVAVGCFALGVTLANNESRRMALMEPWQEPAQPLPQYASERLPEPQHAPVVVNIHMPAMSAPAWPQPAWVESQVVPALNGTEGGHE